MSRFQLLNIKRDGSTEDITIKKSSFNARRSVILTDKDEKVLLLFHGSSVSKEVTTQAEKQIKNMNAKLGFEYFIHVVKPKERKEKIDLCLEILAGKSKASLIDKPKASKLKTKTTKKTKTQKKKTISKKKPKTKKKTTTLPKKIIPPKSRTDGGKRRHRLFLRSTKDEGPTIEDFHIDYYEEHPLDQIKKELSLIYDDSDLESIAKHISVIRQLIQEDANRKKATKSLTDSIQTLVEEIF